MAFFPQMFLSVYTNETALLTESVPSLYVIGIAMLVAAVANIYFNGISGTGNTQAALWLESGTLVIYGIYVFIVGWWAQAPVAVCFTTEIVYYALLLVASLIYLKKAKWQNKKI
jgi:Na+-driven multidrug efflux pump